jgi:hypothetical protein
MAWQITNNLAQSTLATGYTAGDSSISVQSGDGAKFPTSGDFILAFNDPPDFFLKCTARSTDTLTVDTSGAEGSSAINEASACKVTQVITAGVLSDLLAAAGGMVLLEEHTASNSATLDFTSWQSSAYDEYMIEILYLLPASGSVDVWFQSSTDGGSTYDAGSNYSWANHYTGNADGSHFSSSDSKIILCDNQQNNAQPGGACGTMRLFMPNASSYTMTAHDMVYYPGGMVYRITGQGTYLSTTAINAFRVLYSSGNIASGTVRVYGLTH